MVRAWMLTKDKDYLVTAKKALGAFAVPISRGGVLKITDDGFWWYVWGTGERAKPLNAHLFALIGIYEFYDVTRDSKARFLFDKGIETVKNIVGKYDLNLLLFRWSKYDDKLLLYSGPKYHNFHVKQLMKLFSITRDKQFLDWGVRWSNCQKRYGSQTDKWFFKLLWACYVIAIKKLSQKLYKIS